MSTCIVTRRSLPFRHEPSQSPRRGIVVAACLFALATLFAVTLNAAEAADMPSKAPAAPPPYNWSGCYIGGNLGAGVPGSDFTTVVGAGTHLIPADAALVSSSGTGSANGTAFLGGGQAGCNWQSATLVVGLEGDFDGYRSHPYFSNNTNTLTDGVTPFIVTQSLTTDFFATVRPRIGLAADRNLAYITGGAAFTSVSYTRSYLDGEVPAGNGSATISKSLTGWTVGAGWEYAMADHWTFKLEYLFASFPTTNLSGVIADSGGGTNPFHGSADLVVQSLRAGVNLKF